MNPRARLAERIRRSGPIPFDAFVEEALYGPDGFFASARGAGRHRHDFVTSPEVGPLFGALVARALDRWWQELGRPDPFLVVDAGAGRGRLAADVLAASPECARALRYVLVERSDALRAEQRDLLVLEPPEDALGPIDPDDERAGGGNDVEPAAVTGVGPICTALADLPAVPVTGVVFANELLDNLPFRVVERAAPGAAPRWLEVLVGVGGRDGAEFVEDLVPASPDLAAEADHVVAPLGDVGPGTRLPVPTGARDWLQACARVLRRGVLVVVDYVAPVGDLARRGYEGPHAWLRAYRAHRRGTSPLVMPGEQDITADVPLEHLVHVARRVGLDVDRVATQADWLRELGIDELVADARAAWDARAHVGDLEAVRHRSRVGEAAALLDPAGLGAHRVLVFEPA